MKNITTEKENLKMYREHGITEWREKCLVLSDIEKILVESDLEKGVNSGLVAMVKLPFPDFATLYFKQFPELSIYTNDLAFGYKLYMASNSAIKVWSEMVRDPKAKIKDLLIRFKCTYDRSEMPEILSTPYYEMPKKSLSAVDRLFNERELKFLYLSQYIDTKKAIELGLPIAPLLENEQEIKGYDLEGKLASLNPAARIILVHFLGLYGHDRKDMARGIPAVTSVSSSRIINFITLYFPTLFLTPKAFRNTVGFTAPNKENAYFQYKTPYRDIDISLESDYIKSSLPSYQKDYLEALSSKKVRIYMAKKYFGWTDEEICKNFIVTKDEIQLTVLK